MNKTIQQIFNDTNITVTNTQLNAIASILGKDTLTIGEITADNAQNILKSSTCWIIEDLGFDTCGFYRLWLKVNGELIPITIEDLALMCYGTSDADDINDIISADPQSADSIQQYENFQINSSIPVIYIDRYIRYDYTNDSFSDSGQSVFQTNVGFPLSGFYNAYRTSINVDSNLNENTNEYELGCSIEGDLKIQVAPSSGVEHIFSFNFSYNIRDNIYSSGNPSLIEPMA